MTVLESDKNGLKEPIIIDGEPRSGNNRLQLLFEQHRNFRLFVVLTQMSPPTPTSSALLGVDTSACRLEQPPTRRRCLTLRHRTSRCCTSRCSINRLQFSLSNQRSLLVDCRQARGRVGERSPALQLPALNARYLRKAAFYTCPRLCDFIYVPISAAQFKGR